MSKQKTIKPSADAMAVMMQIYLMPKTGPYETVKSTTSIMDDPYAQVI